MSECDHTIDDIARIDPDGITLHGDELTMWGECECGRATIVTAEIADVELDEEPISIPEEGDGE